ncbi:MAG: hypothetical protein MIN69_12320 [Methylorubrum extorquens]|jgi:sulfite reductase alpha subunit-like flavoprotein|uniref:Uncharacterized protein n=2 Tax=Methylorubrum extorquens TaxID=408 RepID=H1KIB5_METEX|nr:hypothetical protein [Methylorubrum extorquens]EHP92750.1 hypothetical protein MetexDRAFT_2377 [Methylorubrum extorquens DSM 13060]
MASLEAIANTLRSVATSGMKPKALLAAVRERHPEATKKEVVRAAFYALTESRGDTPEHLQNLHSFAITERAPDDDEPVKATKLRKKKKAKGRDSGASHSLTAS